MKSESIFNVVDGLISFKTVDFVDFSNYSFHDTLFGKKIKIDHFVLTAKNDFLLKVNEAANFGFQIVINPGVYPDDFHDLPSDFNQSLSMNLCVIKYPGNENGTVVIVSPVYNDDEIHKFIANRGIKAVHHVGVEVNNIEDGIITWKNMKFKQFSNVMSDNGLHQVFMQNKEGQIVELLEKQNKNQATFTFKNASGLRISENN